MLFIPILAFFVLWRLIFSLKHLEWHCAGCVRVLLSFLLLTEKWKWMFGYLGQLRNLNHSSTVTKFDMRVTASFWLFPFLPSLSRSTSTRHSFQSFTNKLAQSPVIRIWLQCAQHPGKCFWHDMTRQVICASVLMHTWVFLCACTYASELT